MVVMKLMKTETMRPSLAMFLQDSTRVSYVDLELWGPKMHFSLHSPTGCLLYSPCRTEKEMNIASIS